MLAFAVVVRAFAIAFLFAGIVSLTACHKSDVDELGLNVKKVETVALDELTKPAQLVIALEQPGDVADPKLGARGFEVTTTTIVDWNGSQDRVDERTAFDTDGHGAFHVVHDLEHPTQVAPVAKPEGEAAPRELVNVSTQGMEAVALNGTVYVRPRYGKFIARPPEPGELERLRALAEARLGDDIQLLQPFLSLADAGTGNVLGRPTRKLSLALDAAPSSSKDERPWRKDMKVIRIDGQIEVDAATGIALLAKLDAEYKVNRAEGPLTTHLLVELVSRPARAITAPDSVPSPRRPRPMVERNQLLDGLAPPAGTQAARKGD